MALASKKPMAKTAQRVKLNIKKGDTVRVLSGRDKGKESEVVKVVYKTKKVVVRDVNIVKKATRSDPKKNPQGGIVPMPAPMHLSNVMLVCPRCSKPTRTSSFVDKTGKRGRKCRKCGEQIDG